MKNYYQIALSFNKETETGEVKKVTENYLVDALSYTEAESMGYKIGQENIRGEFHVVEIRKTRIIDVFLTDNEAPFFKTKIEYNIFDERSSAERKVKHDYVVSAQTLEDGIACLHQHLNTMLVPYKVVGVNEVNLVEVLDYEAVTT